MFLLTVLRNYLQYRIWLQQFKGQKTCQVLSRFCFQIVAWRSTIMTKFSLMFCTFFPAHTRIIIFLRNYDSFIRLYKLYCGLFDSWTITVTIFYIPIHFLLWNAPEISCSLQEWRFLKQICFFHTLVLLLPAMSILVR
jgi:hypothetical protein